MLTRRQLAKLRRVSGAPNRVGAAMELSRPRVTQEQLAAYLGCTQPSVSRIVTGQTDVTLDTTRKLADMFGCHVDDLFPKRREAIAS